MDRADAFAIQALLRRRGYYNGPLDGALGPGSRKAIRALQRDEGLQETGIVTRSTAKALGLKSRKLTDKPAISSFRRQSLKLEPARQLGYDARLLAFLEENGGWSSNIYGFNGDNLYLATKDYNAAIRYYPGKINENSKIYPVSIGNDDENRFVYDLVRHDKTLWLDVGDDWLHGPYIGLRQSPEAREPAGGWSFAKEPDNAYRRWSRGNPDDFQSRQDFARIWVRQSQVVNRMPDLPRGPTWDDAPSFSYQVILELD